MDYTSNCFKSQIKTKLSLSNVRFIPLFNGGRKGGGYSEMKFKLWYCCRDLNFLKIWPSWIITQSLITVHEKWLNETTKKDIFTDICFTYRIRGDGSTSKWKLKYLLPIEKKLIFICNRLNCVEFKHGL